MITRSIWILALSGLLVGSAFGVALANFVSEVEHLRRGPDTPEMLAERAYYEAEIKDATPVQLGVMTDAERAHSRLHVGYASLAGRRLSDGAKAARDSGQLTVGLHIGVCLFSVGPESSKKFFTRLAQESDAIIRGSARKKTSQLTEDNSFIFSDYEILVTEVIKDKGRGLVAGQSITVTRPGGKILLDRILVQAWINLMSPLPLDGSEVVLCLRSAPGSEAYQAIKTTDAFELRDGRVRPLGGQIPARRQSRSPIILNRPSWCREQIVMELH
jgi:hypothetical protein